MEKETSHTDPSPTEYTDAKKNQEFNGEEQMEDNQDNHHVPKISTHDKLFNMTTIVIPHLESMLVDLSKLQSKFNVINKHIIDQLETLKKKLGYLQAITDPDPLAYKKLIKKKSIQKIAENICVSPELVPDGLNLVELDRVLDYIESKLFLLAFKKWRSMPSRTRLAKKMMVFSRKIELIMSNIGPALSMSKDDIFSLDPLGDVWKKISQYTNYIVG